MKDVVRWFIYAVIKGELLSPQQCQSLMAKLGEDVELNVFAQQAYNIRVEELDEEHAKIFLDRFEEIMDYAISQTTSGIAPPAVDLNEKRRYSFDFAAATKMNDEELGLFIRRLLLTIHDNGSSDLHLSANSIPFVRHNLKIEKISDYVLSKEDAFRFNTIFLTEEQKTLFKSEYDLTYSLVFEEEERYRVTLMTHKDGYAGIYHIISNKIRSLKDLGFFDEHINTITRLLDYRNGLIFITGPIGSGKTTAVAALVDILNTRKNQHIITIESPIEIIHKSSKCSITQRQIGVHTESYASAIKSALNEDPDVIVIGELRDANSIKTAITAAETGHMVITTLTTEDPINTLNRIVNIFPTSQQSYVRAVIAANLRGIISQKLLPKKIGGLVVAHEILINTLSVDNIINEGKYYLLKSIIQAGVNAGMCTMDDSIFDLYKHDMISKEIALANFVNRKQYEKLIISE